LLKILKKIYKVKL